MNRIPLTHKMNDSGGSRVDQGLLRTRCFGYSVRGFTLIELMVTIAIAAVLASLAAPAFQSVIANNRLKSHSSAMYLALLLARSEAIKRNVPVVICKSSTGDACVASGGWEQGWIIFHDANSDGEIDVVQRTTQLSGDFSFLSKVSTSSTEQHLVSFGSSGSVASGLTFGVCNRAATGPARTIVLLVTGKARMENATVSTCT